MPEENDHIIEVRSEEERRRLTRRQADRAQIKEQEERRRLLRRYSLLAAAAAIFPHLEYEEGDQEAAYREAVRNAEALLKEIERFESEPATEERD